MPTPGERRALVFIASVAALGVAVRGWHESHPADSGLLAGNRADLARQIQAVDSAIGATSSRRKPRARAKPPTTDDTVSFMRLRGSVRRVGALPSRDTTPRDPRQAYWDRSAHFDSLRRSLDRGDEATTMHRQRNSKATVSAEYDLIHERDGGPVDIDVAELDEIAAVPMIGPALARRIFVDRAENGPFGSIAELERVPGLTHAFARRIERFVTFSGTPRHASAGERRTQSKNERRPGGESRP